MYVRCTECGNVDVPNKKVIPHNVGTRITMRCPDCSNSRDSLARKCRACCPTGHRTRWDDAEPEKPKRRLSSYERHQAAADRGIDTWEDYKGEK